jgi:hypothetical protein
MLRRNHIAKTPDRNVAETLRRRKQVPVFELVAGQRVGDVVGGEGEAFDLHQHRLLGQVPAFRQDRLDEFALLEVVARNDELGGIHFRKSVFRNPVFIAAIFAFADVGFATAALFKTAFDFCCPAITPSRAFSTL